MYDYYEKVHNMSEIQCYDEMMVLQKKLASLTTISEQAYNQLLDMYHTVSEAYQEKTKKRLAEQNNKNKEVPKDEVIEIGEISGEDYTPDYSSDEILNAVVEGYYK